MDKKMSVTALRKHLYRVVDEVLETGVPVEVERDGKTVVISRARTDVLKLARLPRRDAIVGDPDELVSLEVAEWHEPNQLH